MEPKSSSPIPPNENTSQPSQSRSSLEFLASFDINKAFERLKAQIKNHNPAYFDKQNISDAALLRMANITEDIAHIEKNRRSDRFAKLVEVFPAVLSSVFPEIFTFQALKTGRYLDFGKGIDVIFKFEDGMIFGLDLTINTDKAPVVTLDGKNLRSDDVLDITDEEREAIRGTVKSKFINIVLPIDKNEFLFAFNNLSQNKTLTQEQVYLILLKRFYLDKICKFMCEVLTDGKIRDFRNIINKIKKDESLEDLIGVKKVESLGIFKQYILGLIVNMYVDFYQNPEVLKLKDVGF